MQLMTIHGAVLVLLAGASVASADPVPVPARVAAPLPDPPGPRRQPSSLRDQAARVASDLVLTGRDPDLLLTPWQYGRWSANGRAAKLEGGAAAATFVGELILAFGGSPLAAVGALATGATLDSAAADVEANSPPRQKKPAPKPKHRLR